MPQFRIQLRRISRVQFAVTRVADSKEECYLDAQDYLATADCYRDSATHIERHGWDSDDIEILVVKEV